METIILIGIIIGLGAGIVLTNYYNKQKALSRVREQSSVLMKQIQQVFKLITVEGEFSEIFTHRDGKSIFFNLFQMEKRAILIVKARVMIGFDLSRIKINVDANKKLVRFSEMPDPNVISIDTELEYFDVQNGIINPLSGKDLTKINKKAKDFIKEKVNESDLFSIAQNQANETLIFIGQLIESIGWKVVTEKLLPDTDEKVLPKKTPQNDGL
ncbi:MAG: hypothetical protein CR996_01595 [Draconibacterium sp.]|nr:MAG: hypothetical protein CR996_01595 [Draconibacterium sp.]PIF05132.1 MAG: hypothetical protein CSA36_08280 [Draconibacterium sp.]